MLLPGLGHLYWKEYAFGIFVHLVMLLVSVLFFVSFFVSLPAPLKVLMVGLSILFYAFSFVDLARTVRIKRKTLNRNNRILLILCVLALICQLLAPTAPVNFLLKNKPEIFSMDSNRLTPLYSKGDLLKASRLAYQLSISIFDRPVLHTFPERYDIVRFEIGSGQRNTGIIVGLPGEDIQIFEGVVVVDGLPDFDAVPGGMTLTGDWPLTSAGEFSILVVMLNLGSVDQVREIPITNLIGKVSKIF
ncbi:MAG: hypothetical protein U9R56_08335 [candidate division Zixibacteria bacterium]|nr:hypothetical protein [candidate division Zixibacteria bacterium]